MKIKKILALLLLLSIALSIFNICSSSFSVLADDNDISVVSSPEIFNYNSYIKDYSDKEIIKDTVVGTPIGNITDYEGFKGLMMTESAVADFSVDIKKSGLYSLKLSYGLRLKSALLLFLRP